MNANDDGVAPVSGSINQPEKVLSTAEDEELRLLDDVVRSLPLPAVKYLLSRGVCPHCILRIFGKYGPIYSHSSRLSSVLSALVDNQLSTDDPLSQRSANEDSICEVCHGILQFIHVDEKQALVKKDCANDLALSICELVRHEIHQAHGFSLEVFIPPFIREKDNAIRKALSMLSKEKDGCEGWSQEMLQSEPISVKDAIKQSITKPLETLLGVKSCSSSFRVRLTYSSSELPMKTKDDKESNQACKRRKTGFDSNTETGNNGSDFPTSGTDVIVKKCSNSLQNQKVFESSKPSNGKHACHPGHKGHDELMLSPPFSGLSPPFQKWDRNGWKQAYCSQKVSACCLEILCYRAKPIYIVGRYLKYSRTVSQTRWIIGDERMGEASVEEILGGSILPLFKGDAYKFHAAGREDIDVRMLGSGRPFLLEIQNPRVLQSEVSVREMEVLINSLDSNLVKVKNLKVVDNKGWTLMREGEAEKQKQYAALVWISRQLEDKDLQTISSLKDMKILQRTPVRVLHRRSPLEREKIIHWMNIEKIAGNTQYFLLHLCTQAGTYIKEFVHGDLGRTNPSLGSILGCRAEILQLDVTDVKMDCFLDE